jgi:PAS domain S-box-containing protein
MTPRRLPVANIVAAALVTVTTVVFGIYSIASYRENERKQWYDLHRLMDLQGNETAVALALPVWNIDRAQIDKIVAAMASPASMSALSVTAAGRTHGLMRNEKLEYVPWDGRSVPPGLCVVVKPIAFNGQHVGTVHLYYSGKYIDLDLRHSLLGFISTIVAVDVLLVLSVYLVLLPTVVRPIVDIERYAMAVSSGGHEPAAKVSIATASELVSLRSSIETMVRLLDRRYAELQEEMVLRFESEERFRTIFESVNDAIFIVDHDTGEILDVNARMYEMSGYTRDEEVRAFLGQHSSGVAPYTLENALEAVRQARPGDLHLYTWQIRHKDGHVFWVEVNLRMATIGGVQRVIAVARDITQRREMEEALRHSETMSAMGSLVAGVAHEVRNPLFGIAATVDAFEAEFGNTPDSAEYMTTLRNDVARLSRLMHDLLEYGRPQTLVRHAQSIEPVLAEAVRVCAPRARERQIEIITRTGKDLPYVAIDADRMLQVFKNVVENAIDFSPPGNAVAIDANATSSMMVFTISDHGPGFRSEDLPHIFKPFFTRRGGGSGLGLAIVEKIVSDHGGTVEAMNGREGGGRIEIRLPAVT